MNLWGKVLIKLWTLKQKTIEQEGLPTKDHIVVFTRKNKTNAMEPTENKEAEEESYKKRISWTRVDPISGIVNDFENIAPWIERHIKRAAEEEARWRQSPKNCRQASLFLRSSNVNGDTHPGEEEEALPEEELNKKESEKMNYASRRDHQNCLAICGRHITHHINSRFWNTDWTERWRTLRATFSLESWPSLDRHLINSW